ncbi:MAG TPA: glycosyltransferase family 2 protein, partial [Segetibacter sp.]
MNDDILLSICIPTFNRATYLNSCLNSIVKQVGNNPEVEVIISDNLSDDNTESVAKEYTIKYKNIKYFKNETNIGGDKNIIKVLSIANGQYLKLLNDYIDFTDKGLLEVLEIVRKYSENKEVLFFSNGVSNLRRKDFYYTDSLDEFLNLASFWTTWIGAIGFWKEDFHYHLERISFKTFNYLQTELLFENIILKKKAVIYSRRVMIANEVLNKKTGYNFFKLFIDSYLNTLIAGLKDDGKISWRAYYKEKNKFFENFIFFWYKKIKIKKNHSSDVTGEGVEKMIFNAFKYT